MSDLIVPTPEEVAAMRDVYPDGLPPGSMNEKIEQEMKAKAAARPTPDAWRAQLAGKLTDAEKELARDQKALEAARAKVDALTADVRFDEMKVASRAKGVAEFDRLTAKAAR